MSSYSSDQPQPQIPMPALGAVAETPNPPKKSRWKLPCLIGGVVGAGLCLCIVLCVVGSGSLILKAFLEKGKVEKTVDEFMKAMAAKDTTQAYSLFSANSQKETPQSDLDKLLAGNNYALFEGYEKLSINNISLNIKKSVPATGPQGTVATVDGKITYAGGYSGTFHAVLEKHGGKWQIYNINITVPPTKVNP